MHETTADLERLQRLLDDSAQRASPFLRSSFQIPERTLDARSLAARLNGSLTGREPHLLRGHLAGGDRAR